MAKHLGGEGPGGPGPDDDPARARLLRRDAGRLHRAQRLRQDRDLAVPARPEGRLRGRPDHDRRPGRRQDLGRDLQARRQSRLRLLLRLSDGLDQIWAATATWSSTRPSGGGRAAGPASRPSAGCSPRCAAR
ncbi:hypothetical protein ACRAWD_29150 [Caulobacter segnis]